MEAKTRNEKRVFIFDPREGHNISIPCRNLDLWLLSVSRAELVNHWNRVVANEKERSRYAAAKALAQAEQDWACEQLNSREM